MPKSEQRRPRLTRERVLDAGVELADSAGIDALSMRQLAKRLGVEAMSLYNHVSNKDDMLSGMLDRVAAEIEPPPDDPSWRVRVRRRAVSAHDALMRHPWAARLWTTRIRVGPGRMGYLDRAMRDLRGAGFSPGLLDRAFHTIENHVIGHALQAQGLGMAPDEMTAAGREILRSFPAAQYPDLAEHIRYHVENPGGDDEFEFGLDLILDGLERLRVAPGRTARTVNRTRSPRPPG